MLRVITCFKVNFVFIFTIFFTIKIFYLKTLLPNNKRIISWVFSNRMIFTFFV